MGPFGGDARSLAADPSDSRHIFLGTETGWLYESHDGGGSWARVSRIGNRDDLVLDHILVDPTNAKHLLVGVFKVDRPDGGLYISNDGGKSWYEQAEMRGQSVRSMAQSLSDPRQIVAGTLAGVYRSMDDGLHWQLISPAGSVEIHEVESLAIDPVNPDIIYAGTWHLPWKTTDGGVTWSNIKQGIIDDSDVFSIIVDPVKPQIVYASACSGIYKSLDAARQFHKIQGIPSTARRTRKLLQDPSNPEILYAGTTEGLYRTLNGGETFQRMTGPEIIVNDVYVDPKSPNHVVIATDRGGVLSSDDAGNSFRPSNNGFSARQISAYAGDSHNAATVYVGVVNDKQTGGVFQSTDGGIRWEQQSDGLAGRDVFSLASTAEGTLLAGTNHGIFRLAGGAWSPSGALTQAAVPARVAAPKAAAPAKGKAGKAAPAKGKAKARVAAAKPKPAPVAVAAPAATSFDGVVYSFGLDGDALFAGTAQGLLRGSDDGQTWSPVATLQMPETHFVAVQKSMVLVAGLRRMSLSVDGGGTWDTVALPPDLTQIAAIAIDELKNLWVGGREGVYYSTDYGLNWKTLPNLYTTEVDGIFFDATGHRVLVTSSNQSVAFAAHLPDYKITYWETGWKLRFARPVGDHLIGATIFDGMVLQPQMVDSSLLGDRKQATP